MYRNALRILSYRFILVQVFKCFTCMYVYYMCVWCLQRFVRRRDGTGCLWVTRQLLGNTPWAILLPKFLWQTIFPTHHWHQTRARGLLGGEMCGADVRHSEEALSWGRHLELLRNVDSTLVAFWRSGVIKRGFVLFDLAVQWPQGNTSFKKHNLLKTFKICVFPYMYSCYTYTRCPRRSEEGVGSLIVNRPVDAGNWTQVTCKRYRRS